MKGKYNRILSVVLAAVVAFGTLAFSTGSVYASGSTLALDDTLWLMDSYAYGVWVDNDKGKEQKITSVVVNDKTVAKVNKDKFDGNVRWSLTPKKTGKVKVTATYKTSSGKKKVSKTVKVKKYPNQIKSLKVNGKTVSTKKYQNYYDKKYTGTSVKIKTALKDGWKLKSVYCDVTDKNYNGKPIKVSKSTILNGKAIKFAKKYKYFFLDFEMQNKSTGDIIRYSISLNR